MHPSNRHGEGNRQRGEPDFEIVADRAYDFIQDCAIPPFDAALIYHGSLGLRRPEAKSGPGVFALNQLGDYETVVPQDEISVVDTVGAGDAFASVCILGLLRQWDLKTLLFRAQSFASALVGRQGATVLDPGFYQQLLRAWKA